MLQGAWKYPITPKGKVRICGHGCPAADQPLIASSFSQMRGSQCVRCAKVSCWRCVSGHVTGIKYINFKRRKCRGVIPGERMPEAHTVVGGSGRSLQEFGETEETCSESCARRRAGTIQSGSVVVPVLENGTPIRHPGAARFMKAQ